jgi:hypothetical protein
VELRVLVLALIADSDSRASVASATLRLATIERSVGI